MDERRFERLGATYGIAFAVLLVASILTMGNPPHIDDPVGKISSFFTDHHDRVITATMLNAFTALAFLLFVGHLRHVMARSERNTEAVAPVVLLAGVATPVLALLTTVPTATLAIMGRQGALGDTGAVRALYDAVFIGNGLVGITVALFVGSLGFAMVKGELAEPWLGYLGMVLAIPSIAVGVFRLYGDAYSSAWTAVDLITTLAFVLFILAAGVIMLMKPEESRAAERQPLLATSGA